MKRVFLSATLILLVCSISLAQPIDSLVALIKTVMYPPNLKGMDIASAFQAATTWLSALLVVVSVWGVQLVPQLGDVLKKIPSGYLRALIIGGGLLWIIVINGGLYGYQAIIAFALSNILWELYKIFKPQPAPTPLIDESQTSAEIIDNVSNASESDE